MEENDEIKNISTNDLLEKINALEKKIITKDIILSTISHDLNNGFNNIINFAKLTSNDKSLTDNHRKVLNRILANAERGYILMENIFEWQIAQNENDTKKIFINNLNKITDYVTRTFADLALEKNITTEIQINDDLYFECNPNHLKTVLRNLYSNAIKYSNKDETIKISNILHDNKICIVIEDHGIGIPDNIINDLFSINKNNIRYGTNQEKGSGIGLFIVKDLVEINNGKVSCESSEKDGTKFTIEFNAI